MEDSVCDSLDRVAPRDLSGVHWSVSAGEWGARLSGFKSLFWHVLLWQPGCCDELTFIKHFITALCFLLLFKSLELVVWRLTEGCT